MYTISIYSVGVKNWFLPSNQTPTERIETVYAIICPNSFSQINISQSFRSQINNTFKTPWALVQLSFDGLPPYFIWLVSYERHCTSFLITMYKAWNIFPSLGNNQNFCVRTQRGQQLASWLVSSNDDSWATLLIGNQFEEFVERVFPLPASCCNCHRK